MSSRRSVLLGVCSMSIVGTTGLAQTGEGAALDEASKEAREGRDRELFLESAVDIAEGRHIRARILLKTLIGVYPESPLVQKAKLLLFFSTATSYPGLFGGREVLAGVNKYIEQMDADAAASGS